MKTVFSIAALSLASLVAATDYYKPPPPSYPPVVTKYEPGPVYQQSTTIYYTSTSTSLCPVTTVITEGGKTYTKTYTTTSTVYINVPTVVYQTVHQPDQTTNVYEQVTITSTSLCPVTEVKTLPGGVVTLTYTSTTTYVQVIPKTEYEYHTQYLTSVVHETVKTVETEYTTVKAGSTIVIATTLKNTVLVTDEYTITKTEEPPTTKATVYEPITLATSIPVTQVVTIPQEVTATLPTTEVTTVAVPTTLTTLAPVVNTTSAPIQISGNSAPTNKPIALAVAGGIAMLAAFA